MKERENEGERMRVKECLQHQAAPAFISFNGFFFFLCNVTDKIGARYIIL